MLVVILTVSGYVLPIIYNKIFSVDFLLYYRLPDIAEVVGIGVLFCIIGVIVGLSGIFNKNIDNTDKIICSICTLLCLFFILCTFPLPCTGRESARRISCHSNLRQISMVLQQYAMDYAGYYPPVNGAAGLEVLRKNDYLTDYDVYRCPSSATERGRDNQPLTEEILDYVYIGGLNTKSDPNLPLAYDKAKNHGNYYGNVLFVDGTVKSIEGDPWTQNIKK